VWNKRRVVYYAILLLLILGELLGERNYIIIIFPEYDTIPNIEVASYDYCVSYVHNVVAKAL